MNRRSAPAKIGDGARTALVLLAAAVLAGALAACASGDERGQRDTRSTSAIGARLVPLAGGVGHGLVTFKPYDGGVVMVAEVGGLSPGAYRIVIHTTPVCTSPNGFSAGPPFLPPPTGAPVIVATAIHHQGTASIVTRVPGVALSGPAGIEGRSVVVHASGSGSLEASPGVVNDRVACGAIGVVPTLF